MNTDFHIVIPARYESSRLPGKPLLDLGGMSVLERVYRQALLANPQSILIATDDARILEHARGFGAEVMLTAKDHQSGSDRVAEAVAKAGLSHNDIVVNVQGDEPFIHPQLIKQVAAALRSSNAFAATLCWPITCAEQFHNPNVVKVVRDASERALYFSRSPIPANRDQTPHRHGIYGYRHIGLYAYRIGNLFEYVNWPSCDLENSEALEQLRILWSGQSLKVEQACVEPQQDINTLADLQAALRQLGVQ